MGDRVYPGVNLYRVDESVTVMDLEKMVRRCFGENPRLFENGHSAECVIMKERGQSTCNVVLKGLKLSYNEIRKKLAMQKIKKRVLFVRDVGFGVRRYPNGHIMDNEVGLHNRLKSGQGMSDGIVPMTSDFVAKYLANYNEPSHMIVMNGKLSADERDLAKSWLPNLIFTFEDNDNANWTDLFFVHRVNALEGILRLNLCEELGRKKIIVQKRDNETGMVSSDEVSYSGQKLLGWDDEKAVPCSLDTDSCMESYGYIPFKAVNTMFIDKNKIHYLNVDCAKCKSSYDFLGFSPDLNWFAANCQCDPKTSAGNWEGKEFVRLMYPKGEALRTIRSSEAERRMCRLMPMIRGQVPLFGGVDDFLGSGLAALRAEFSKNAREMNKNTRFGRVECCSLLEVFDDKKEVVYTVEFTVARTEVWDESRQVAIDTDKIVEAGSSRNLFRNVTLGDYDSQRKQMIRGKVVKMENFPDSYVRVVVRVSCKMIEKPNRRRFYVLIPQISRKEYENIEKASLEWQLFENNRECQTVVGDILNATHFGLFEVIPEFKPAKLWVLNVSQLEYGPLVPVIERSDDSLFYKGADIVLSLMDGKGITHKVQTTVRIIEIWSQTPTVVGAKIAVLLHSSWRGVVVKKGGICLWPWVITASAAAAVCDEEKMEEKRTTDYESDNIDIYIDERVENFCYRDYREMIRQWRHHPTSTNFSSLDYLLRLEKPFMLHQCELALNMEKQSAQPLDFEGVFTPVASQLAAIENVMNRRLSIMIGPCGTGKSTTASLGIVQLVVEKGGLVLVTCPSNFAADVLYKKTKEVAAKLGVQTLSVIRLQSRGRERMVDLSEDEDALHVRVRKRNDLRANPEMYELVQRYEANGFVGMKSDERSDVMDYLDLVSVKEMAKADVIVCTVGCASDGRLHKLRSKLQTMGKRLAALVIDEASLLTIPSTLPVLTLNPERLWLIGDPKQLPPTVKDCSAINACLDVSLLEMLQLTPYVQKGGAKVNIMLDVQFRMAMDIGRMVSNQTYEGELKSAESVHARNYRLNAAYVKLGRRIPVLRNHSFGVVTYRGKHEERNQGDCSLWNPMECSIIQNLVKQIYSCGFDLKSMVIIAMYDLQVRKLSAAINGMGTEFEKVNVCSVDSFQGKEAPIVIVSMVRSNCENDVGFLKEHRRLNVAVSRAIDRLLVVADVDTMLRCGMNRIVKFFQTCKNMGVIRVEDFW